MKKYTIELIEPEMEFLRQILRSDIPISIQHVETVSDFKKAVARAEANAKECGNPDDLDEAK